MIPFSEKKQNEIWQLYKEGNKDAVEKVIQALEVDNSNNYKFCLFKQSYYHITGNHYKMIMALEQAVNLKPIALSLNLIQRLEHGYKSTKQYDQIKIIRQKLENKELSLAQQIWEHKFLKENKLDESEKSFLLNIGRKNIEKYFYCKSSLTQIAHKKIIEPLFPYFDATEFSTFIRRSENRLRNLFTFQNKIIKEGFFCTKCPYTNQPLKSNESYLIKSSSNIIFYLYRETKPFFIVIGDVWQEVIGYFFPLEEIYVHITRNNVPIESAICKLKSLIVCNYNYLEDRELSNSKKCVIINTRHYAHHLWNELSALDRIIEKGLHKLIDKIIVFAQPLGELNQLFPELNQKFFSATNDNIEIFEQKILRENNQILPLGDAFISEKLILRIKQNYNFTIPKSVKQEVSAFKTKSKFCLWISIRTGAKTWHNQAEQYFELIKSINEKNRNTGVIIDGYSLPFFYEKNIQIEEVIKVEKKIINRLTVLLNKEKIPFKVLTGRRIDEAVKWGEIAQYYIVHQGSIQHKIAWFHNCSGYIHTNKSNLKVAYKERPGVWEREGMIPPVFIEASFVTDANEKTLLRGQTRQGGIADNYSIDLKKVKVAIRHHIDQINSKNMTTKNILKWGNTTILGPHSFNKIRYFEILKRVHDLFVKNYNYFEIGTNTGNSMQFAKGHAVGVDPNFIAEQNIVKNKASLCLYQTTSDDFFECYADRVYGLHKIDMAFIDGLHHSDQVLLDFINTEKYSKKDTIVFFHDILPRTYETALKERETQMWTGDVWKAIWVLYQERPDLDFIFLDAPPSGLLLVQYKSQSEGSRVTNFLNKVSKVKDDDIYTYLETIEVVKSNEFIQFINKNDKIPKSTDLAKRKLVVHKN